MYNGQITSPKKINNNGQITVNSLVIRSIYTLPNCGLKLDTLPILDYLCLPLPTSVKNMNKYVFLLLFMFLSS